MYGLPSNLEGAGMSSFDSAEDWVGVEGMVARRFCMSSLAVVSCCCKEAMS